MSSGISGKNCDLNEENKSKFTSFISYFLSLPSLTIALSLFLPASSLLFFWQVVSKLVLQFLFSAENVVNQFSPAKHYFCQPTWRKEVACDLKSCGIIIICKLTGNHSKTIPKLLVKVNVV